MKSRFQLHFDRDYGIDRRTGWSVIRDGVVLADLEPWLVVALWKAFRFWRSIECEPKKPAKPSCYVSGESRVSAEIGKALGIFVPFRSLTLRVAVDEVISATVELPVEWDSLERFKGLIREYHMTLQEDNEPSTSN